MKYSRFGYGYVAFGLGIVLAGLVSQMLFGSEYFSVQAEYTTNWFIASLVFALLSIPVYVLGVICLVLIGRFSGRDMSQSLPSINSWAFASGLISGLLPALSFTAASSMPASPLLITWLPIVATSLIYFAVSKYR